MKIAIVGATGSIGSIILQQTLQRDDVDSIVTITRKPLPSTDPRVHNAIIEDFGNLDDLSDATWSSIRDADTLVWAMGTYTLNEDVNFTYPLQFQRHLVQRSNIRDGKTTKIQFILLGGAFTETNQSQWLWFLPAQRHMKGLLQTEILTFAHQHSDTLRAIVIKPGGVLMGGDTFVNKVAQFVFTSWFVIRGEELGTAVAELAVNGSKTPVIPNQEMVEIGRRLDALSAKKAL
ncbi:hypothetical protein C7974DRAFT_65168 [Boeremia exigua]|uniref:uncharacterized protein n=1 Tax=Boeremia exigua TaxID=749465 RepID=UPI001E8D67C5|nr:uncharacterized protein C7974DRAFT_65168 [Boeremia exigua]KAH6615386.1 hypothetical protein C7974DRAFT_65168 [Boeremia exigua]